MLELSRRQAMLGVAATGAAAAFPARADDADGLRIKAQRTSRLYGAAVSSQRLAQDASFAETVAREANVLVAEFETKRRWVQPAPDRYDFSGSDKILEFARTHGQTMRGHALCWYDANPAWLGEALAQKRDMNLLTDYVRTVAGHYKGAFPSWDVVNEAIEPLEGQRLGLRAKSMWYQAFGEDYIAAAFHAAKETDPEPLLFYNELNVEGSGHWFQRRRDALLELLDRLLARKVPVEALGIQGHLKLYLDDYDDEIFSKFLDDVISMGLKVMITEFDVADIKGPDDPVRRDADVAALTKRFLDVAFSKEQVLGCLTWGISDKYSWLSSYAQYKWPDGRLSRGLPFDEQFHRKPMWTAMAAAYDGAKTGAG